MKTYTLEELIKLQEEYINTLNVEPFEDYNTEKGFTQEYTNNFLKYIQEK